MIRKRWRLDIEERPFHLGHIRLQAGSPTVAGWSTGAPMVGCSLDGLWLQGGCAHSASSLR